jgi:hypothetical protein
LYYRGGKKKHDPLLGGGEKLLTPSLEGELKGVIKGGDKRGSMMGIKTIGWGRL